MQLCVKYQSSLTPHHRVHTNHQRILPFTGFLFNILRFFQPKGILKSQSIIHNSYLVFFGLLVNCFTISYWPTFTGYIPHQIGTIPPARRVPHRTIRRVHIMPWATPIRRIGRTRLKHIKRENDDPSKSLRC
jgi:hypothetical protein